MKNLFKKKKKTDRDPEAEFRRAVGMMMQETCRKRATCQDCPFKDKTKIDCVQVMRECGV